jgi:hypothetical protein
MLPFCCKYDFANRCIVNNTTMLCVFSLAQSGLFYLFNSMLVVVNVFWHWCCCITKVISISVQWVDGVLRRNVRGVFRTRGSVSERQADHQLRRWHPVVVIQACPGFSLPGSITGYSARPDDFISGLSRRAVAVLDHFFAAFINGASGYLAFSQ